MSYSNAASRLLSIQPGSGAGAASGDKAGGIGNANSGQNRDTLLARVPPGTGGARLMIEVPSALQVALEQLAAALVSQYAVTYTRPEGPTPKALQMGQMRNGVNRPPRDPPKSPPACPAGRDLYGWSLPSVPDTAGDRRLIWPTEATSARSSGGRRRPVRRLADDGNWRAPPPRIQCPPPWTARLASIGITVSACARAHAQRSLDNH